MTKAQERRLTEAVDAQQAVEDALVARDKALHAAVKVGVTQYRLAQETGLSAPGIAKILKR